MNGVVLENPNVFVTSLPASFRDGDLRNLFSPFGGIESVKVMMDLETGYSKRYGFVQFEHLDDANRAIMMMNGHKFSDGTSMIVKKAKTNGFLGTPSSNIVIKGLSTNFCEAQLQHFFSNYGHIVESRIIRDLKSRDRVSRGIAFVRYHSVAEAENAIKDADGSVIEYGHAPVRIKFADTPQEKDDRKIRYLTRKAQAEKAMVPPTHLHQHHHSTTRAADVGPMKEALAEMWRAFAAAHLGSDEAAAGLAAGLANTHLTNSNSNASSASTTPAHSDFLHVPAAPETQYGSTGSNSSSTSTVCMPLNNGSTPSYNSASFLSAFDHPAFTLTPTKSVTPPHATSSSQDLNLAFSFNSYTGNGNGAFPLFSGNPHFTAGKPVTTSLDLEMPD